MLYRMRKIEITVTEVEKELLLKESKKNPKEKVRNRAKVILLRAQGMTEKEIINKTDLSLNTILSYIKKFKVHGIDSIYSNNYKGHKSRLEPYADEIISDFKKNPITSAKEGCTRIFDTYGIKITENPLREFLKKKDFHIKKPKQCLQKRIKKNRNYFWLKD